MHRNEKSSMPRIDLLDQSRYYNIHIEKLRKMKPCIDTSPIEPIKHHQVFAKEKEREIKYADFVANEGFQQIQEIKSPINGQKSPRLKFTKKSENFLKSRPEFTTRTSSLSSSSKDHKRIYKSPFAKNDLSPSASNLDLSESIGSSTSILSMTSSSTSSEFFLTQKKKKDYAKYVYSNANSPRVTKKKRKEIINTEVKDGIKMVQFTGELVNSETEKADSSASKFNSHFRKTFFVLNSSQSARGSPQWKSNLDISNQSRKIKTKSEEKRFREKFENVSGTTKYPKKIKLKTKQSFAYEFIKNQVAPSISWADQNDLIIDESESELYLVSSFDSSESTPTKVDAFYNEDRMYSDEDNYEIIHLGFSDIQVYESFELEIAQSQHEIDVPLIDVFEEEEDDDDYNDNNCLLRRTEEFINGLINEGTSHSE